MLTATLLAAAQDLVAAPSSPTPTTNPVGGTIINSAGIVEFILRVVVPPIAAFIGVIFLGRAKNGEISKVLTSSAIVIFGIAFIAAAPILMFAGGHLVDLFIAK